METNSNNLDHTNAMFQQEMNNEHSDTIIQANVPIHDASVSQLLSDVTDHVNMEHMQTISEFHDHPLHQNNPIVVTDMNAKVKSSSITSFSKESQIKMIDSNTKETVSSDNIATETMPCVGSNLITCASVETKSSITNSPTDISLVSDSIMADVNSTKILDDNISVQKQASTAKSNLRAQVHQHSSKGQILNLGSKLTLVAGSQIPQEIKISSGQTTQQPQQPIFVTNQDFFASGIPTLQAGNISYIIPTNNNLAKQSTLTFKPGPTTSIANPLNNSATLLLNPVQGGKTNNTGGHATTSGQLKLLQTDQGPQLILAASYKPNQTNATISISSKQVQVQNKPNQFISANQTPGPISNQQTSGQQQLLLLSPVKQAQGSQFKTGGFTFPPGVKILPQSPVTSKLQQIAPAPFKSITTQRAMLPNKSTISIANPSGSTKQIQTIVHSNSKNVQYISFVPTSSGSVEASAINHPIANHTQAKLITNANKIFPLKPFPSPVKNITPMVGGISNNQTVKPNMVHLTTAGIGLGSGINQKVLINSNTIKVSGTNISTTVSKHNSGSNKNSNNTTTTNSGGKPTSIWMLPKQHAPMFKLEPGNSGSFTFANVKSLNPIGNVGSKFIPIAPHPSQVSGSISNSSLIEPKITATTAPQKLPITPIDSIEESRRKPCNCTRSQCLKLYCDCFANGEFCSNCNCNSCCNNLANEEIRQKAIRLCLERNPNAFHPKIGQHSQHGDVERKHTKGCCCKRSGCLKNYCECYEAKILCSDKCKCVGCKNFEESTERKTLMNLADAAEFRSDQQAYTSKVQIWGSDLKLKLPVKVKGDSHPFNIFTTDILETTASCLLAQAEEGEFENYSEENVENLVLEQFGECLSQILNLSNHGVGEEFSVSDDDDDRIINQISENQTIEQHRYLDTDLLYDRI